MLEQKKDIPNHLGLILDGNRRWAVKQGLPVFEGHKKGYETLKNIVTAAFEQGVKCVSAYVFSTENWNRSEEEVKYLMNFLLWVVKNEVSSLHEKNIRLRFAGSELGLRINIIKAIDEAEEKTKNNTGGTLVICFNYGGQQEISDAVKQIVRTGTKPEEITPELIGQHLYVPDIPPIDLVIRSSGEQRLSNFMIWRTAYSELMFIKKYWPAFTKKDLNDAFKWYAERDRRFGV